QFAQGPTQAVNVPSDTEASNQTFTGLPLAIVNGAGITSGQVTLHFNPALLELTGTAAPAAGIDSFTVSGIDNVHGSATLAFTSATALPADALTLGTLGATVQDVYATAYRAKELLHLDGLTLMAAGTPLAGQTMDGAHVAAFRGDASGDGKFGVVDANLAS